MLAESRMVCGLRVGGIPNLLVAAGMNEEQRYAICAVEPEPECHVTAWRRVVSVPPQTPHSVWWSGPGPEYRHASFAELDGTGAGAGHNTERVKIIKGQ